MAKQIKTGKSILSQEMTRLAIFSRTIFRVATEYPEYKDDALEAQEAVRNAQKIMAATGRIVRWRAYPPIKRMIHILWERFGVVPY